MSKMMIYHALMGVSLAVGASRERVWGVDMLVKTIDPTNEAEVNEHKADGWHKSPQDVIDELEKARLTQENQKPRVEVGNEKIKGEWDFLIQENKRLKQEVAELTARLGVYETAQDGNKDGVVAFDEMTADQLKAYLDGKGIKYDKRTGKEGLIALAVGTDGVADE